MKTDYKRKQAFFICSSPYQILGAIGITKALRLQADLFIIETFLEAEDVFSRIRKTGVFSEVFFARKEPESEKSKWNDIRKIVFADRYVAGLFPADISYDSFYTTSRTLLKSALLKVLRDRNPDMKTVIFDEGMGTYSDSMRLFKINRPRKVLEALCGWDLDDPARTEVMAYLPDLIKLPPKLRDCPVRQMPRLPLSEENRLLLESLFSVDQKMRIAEKYIIFDTNRHGNPEKDRISKEQMELLDACYDTVLACSGGDIICKPHPKSVVKTSCDLALYPYQGVPIEILYAGMRDLNDRILITFVSTAAFTPKILYDCEPRLVFLHRLVHDNAISSNFDGIFDKIKGVYRDQSRVFAPSTLDELKQVLISMPGS